MQIINPINHIVYRGQTLPPVAGGGYDYVLAGNGLFLRAENWFIDAAIPISYAQVRGLKEFKEYFSWKLPPVPRELFEVMIREAQANSRVEMFFQMAFRNGHYELLIPKQSGTAANVFYDIKNDEGVVLEAHSHPGMEAFYSPEDDTDEKGFRIYEVLGSTEGEFLTRQCIFRLGIYGYYFQISMKGGNLITPAVFISAEEDDF